MNQEAVLNSPLLASPDRVQTAHLHIFLRRAGWTLVVAVLLLAAWVVRHNAPYNSSQGLGYGLGLAGGLLLLGLLLYPLRKRLRLMHGWGGLKYWFQFHMVGGVFGPLLILFHSTFHVGSFNAAVALACMLLVVASGVVGRFMYRKIHLGLYGAQASLKDLEQALAREFELLAPTLHRLPQVKQAFENFAALVSCRPAGRFAQSVHFVSLGFKRVIAMRRLRESLANPVTVESDPAMSPIASLNNLLQTIDSALQLVQRRGQLATYERLFSLWHVIHIPFLCMLVITAIVHVVAVHAY